MLVYNHFVSPLVQLVTVSDVLPISEDVLETDGDEREHDRLVGDFIFEPEPEEILERLLPVYLETEIYRALLESAASEQGARMTAMRNASKSAGELIDDAHAGDEPRPTGRDHAGDPRGRRRRRRPDGVERLDGPERLRRPSGQPRLTLLNQLRSRLVVYSLSRCPAKGKRSRLVPGRARGRGLGRVGRTLGEGIEPVKARCYWEQVWIRFRRDKVAMASGVFIIFLVLTAIFGGPIAAHFLGHGPNDIFCAGVNNDLLPVGPWTHVADPTVADPTTRPCSSSVRTTRSAATSSCACSTGRASRSRSRCCRRSAS